MFLINWLFGTEQVFTYISEKSDSHNRYIPIITKKKATKMGLYHGREYTVGKACAETDNK